MKKFLRRAIVKEIISCTTRTYAKRDYQSEYDLLTAKTDSAPFSYHNLDIHPYDSTLIDINDLAEWVSKRKNLTIHEDPTTGEPAIYNNHQVREYVVKLSFAYHKIIHEVTIKIELGIDSKSIPHEGTKIWIIVSSDQDDFVVERVYV